MIVFPVQMMKNIPEAMIQKIVLAHVNRIPGVKVWRMNTGSAQMRNGQWVDFGYPGQADLAGIFGPHGRRIEIELKSQKGRARESQVAYREMIESFGGVYLVARSLEAAVVPVCKILGVEYSFA